MLPTEVRAGNLDTMVLFPCQITDHHFKLILHRVKPTRAPIHIPSRRWWIGITTSALVISPFDSTSPLSHPPLPIPSFQWRKNTLTTKQDLMTSIIPPTSTNDDFIQHITPGHVELSLLFPTHPAQFSTTNPYIHPITHPPLLSS